MTVLLASAVDGLMLGLIYGLASMGLTLIWGVMRVFNLAHGAAIAAGMFGVYLLTTEWRLNPYAGLLVVALAGLAVGAAVYRIALARIVDGPELMTLLATFSFNLVLIGAGTFLFSTTPRSVSTDLGAVSLGLVHVPVNRLVAAALSLAAALLLYGFLYRTRLGVALRAVSDNRAAASLVGIDPGKVLALAFGIGSMLAAFSGGLIATLFPFTVLSGGPFELRSFLVVVLGGLGSPRGALLGGVSLGLMEGLATPFLPVSWVPVLVFSLLVLLLLVRARR